MNFVKFNPVYKLLLIPLLAGLAACGSETNPQPQNNTQNTTQTETISGTEISIENAEFDINLTASSHYQLTLEQDVPNLVISLAKGQNQTQLGDPDLYVKYNKNATTTDFDCVSYNGADENETCIINNAKAGKYSILVNIENGKSVTNATLWASASLLPVNQACNDALIIQAQQMTSSELDLACGRINQVADKFHALFATLSPEPNTPIAGDLNEQVQMTVFSSLSNHKRWINYLFNDDANRSGIYYEGSPDKWYHKANIVTFNPLEWTDGYSLVRSDNHEYVHYLDGRYNKAGGYRSGLGWWSEGLAEYLTTSVYNRYKIAQSGDLKGNPYTLSEIFKGFSGNADPYKGGLLAVAFFIEQHPSLVTELLGYSRAGNWTEWDNKLALWAVDYQAEFTNWLNNILPQNYQQSAQSITLNNYVEIVGRHGFLYQLDLPEAADNLTIKVTGNQADASSMDLDLYVKQNSAPTLSNFDCKSQQSGSNEVCQLTNVTAGQYYILLDSKLSWAADYIDTYLTVCTGTDCEVALPERKTPKTIKDVAIPLPPETLPAANELADCNAIRSYQRTSDSAQVSVTNTTDVAVKLYWINNQTGEPAYSSAYANLTKDQNYSADYWVVGDRMVITDINNQCLAVAIMQQAENSFEITQNIVKNATNSEKSSLSSCELAVPYNRTNDGAQVTVTNKTATEISLYWVNNTTGKANFDSAYATLAQDQSYSANYWVIGDRMMLTDSNQQCIGIADLQQATNNFDITSADLP